MASRLGIGADKWQALGRQLAEAGILPDDLQESFIRASGPGGQHVNKTASAVRLLHVPSGLEIKAQSSRSQAQNRYQARVRLLAALQAERDGVQSAAQAQQEKIRRQKRKRSKRAKAKMLADKRHAGEKKQARAPVRRSGKDSAE